MRDRAVSVEVETLYARYAEREITREALRLHVLAVAHSVHTVHPEFIADIALARIVPEATIPAFELWVAGLWERIDGGYAIMDAEFVHHMTQRAAGQHLRSVRWQLRQRAIAACRRSWRALNSESVIPL